MVRLALFFGVLLMLSAGGFLTSLAGDAPPVDVGIDQAQLIRLDADAAQVILGNPAIADVTAQSPRLLVVTGKSHGATNLIALDAEGREILAARVDVRDGDAQQVTLYRGTARHSFHCAPNCQRTLAIGDDKDAFGHLADTVTRKFGVVNAAAGGN